MLHHRFPFLHPINKSRELPGVPAVELYQQTIAIDSQAEPVDSCAVCTTPLQGEFCHACGQRRTDSTHFTVRHLLGEAFREITSLDGKIWSTARLLYLKPGLLVNEYLQGRGSLHLGPVKLYLIAIALYFFLAPYGILSPEQIRQAASQYPTGQASEFFARMQERMESGAFFDTYQNLYTAFLGLTVFLSALALKIWYRKRYLGEHFVFALYELAFIFLMVIPMSVLPWLSLPPLAYLGFTAVMILGYGVWLTFALRRVYEPRWSRVIPFALVYLFFRELVDNTIGLAVIVIATL
jgi:hypothetical protein